VTGESGGEAVLDVTNTVESNQTPPAPLYPRLFFVLGVSGMIVGEALSGGFGDGGGYHHHHHHHGDGACSQITYSARV
jgi:hypothetical protein